jgi:4-hydroxyphenylpyruvate dioxygenase-like putative hemolysin
MYSDSFLLELLTPERSATQEHSPKNQQNTMRGSLGITHLGMRVQNPEAAIARLKAAGATMLGEPFQVAKETTKIVSSRVGPKIVYAREHGIKPWRITVFSGA